ncbi:MAG: acyl--CoA ligase [Devosiaceae bacterium]|nr:acyl--CoA ligase [Devosiaceae bacterium MH13]
MDDTQILPILQAERARIEAIPIAPSLRAYLDERFTRFADAPALNFFEDHETRTYGALGREAWALAHALHTRGVGHGTRVAMMVPNRVEFPITWCALALLGATVVPVNVRYTTREVAYVVSDSEAQFVVIDESLLPVYQAWEKAGAHVPADRTILVGAADPGAMTGWDTLLADGDPTWHADWPVAGSDLMNIQYTSGTTGFPKGVELTARYWLLTAHIAYHMFAHKPKNVLAAQPYFYMDPQWLTMTAFYDGGTIHAARQASASRFVDWCRQNGVDRALMPEVVTKQAARADDDDNPLKSVWTFNWRGPNRAASEERFNLSARECFGMTEIGLALYTPTQATHRAGSQSCGWPLPFREAEIRDDDAKPVPRGTIGELWIRGDSVAKAYWNKPDANAVTFVDGWFATGDLFMQDEAGWFTIVGRKKDMIRRSSENIAAREVEAVLQELPGISEAAVLPVPDDYRGEEVKAYLILVDGETPQTVTPEQIIAHCTTRLAGFKIPRFIDYADELPRTPGRKVAKHKIIAATGDLRQGAWDRTVGDWLP